MVVDAGEEEALKKLHTLKKKKGWMLSKAKDQEEVLSPAPANTETSALMLDQLKDISKAELATHY